MPASPEPPRPSRRARWASRARRALLGIGAAFLVVTLVCAAYASATTPPATLAAPDGADIDVNGTRVHYRAWGDDGPEVLLVHGSLESTASWQPMAEHLARDHRVYAVDLAGFGYTEYTGRYTLDDQVALVSGFIDELHLRPALVGHSLGAAVVGAVALRRPWVTRGVVFLDGDALPFGSPDTAAKPNRTSWLMRTPWGLAAYRYVVRSPWAVRRAIAQTCGSRCEGLTDDLAAAWARPLRQGDAEAAVQQMMDAGVLALSETQVRAIDVPRAIIWGEEDVTGVSLPHTRANLGHPPTRIVEDAGHLSMVARPDVVARHVAELTDIWA